MVTVRAGPTVWKMPRVVKARPKNVMATVPAEPATTAPMSRGGDQGIVGRSFPSQTLRDNG